METTDKLVVFNLDEQRFALDLACVERVIRIAEITPVPKAPPFLLGIINMNSRVIPVFNTRILFDLPDTEIELSDNLIVVLAAGLKVALLTDEVTGVLPYEEQKFVGREEIFPGIGEMQGVVRLDDGMIFIYDLNRFLAKESLAALCNDPVNAALKMSDEYKQVSSDA
ncbi:MAG: chemotaxis protein CheW [Syntrophales bacterium]